MVFPSEEQVSACESFSDPLLDFIVEPRKKERLNWALKQFLSLLPAFGGGYPSNFLMPGGFLAAHTGENRTFELQSLERKTWPVKVAAPQIPVEIRCQQGRSLEACGAFLPFIL